ncbi:MFS transporter [Nonomuraea sp. NPDC050451]|uniref:MFS transporter n=1 Tax=Nonomuraea sp. NPDC050451 TaxID=3364364 RepID=UPI0037A20D8F
MTASLPFRLARAAVFAVVCVALGVLAHLFGGGSVAGPVMAGGLLLAFGAAAVASGRERPLAVILPLLAGLQVVLHVLFSLSHTPAVHAGLGHAHAGLAPSAGMLVAHAGATGLIALWLARGEAALWGLLHRLAARLCQVLLVVLPQPVHEPVAVVTAPEPGRLRSVVLAHSAPRRGPPFTQVFAFSS